MDKSAKPRKRPGPIHQSPVQNLKRAPPPPPQAGGTLAAFLDNVKPGYSRFTDAFVAHGWEDEADLLYTRVPAHELVSLLKDAGAKLVQMSRIVAALVDLGYPKSYQSHLSYLLFGPMSWLDEVKEGFGMRYGATFASEGFEDAEDLKFSCPNQQKLETILEKAGAAKPQVERITAALVKLTGAPLQQQQPQKDKGRPTPPPPSFGAKESPSSPAATTTSNIWPSQSFANIPAKVIQTTPSTRTRSLTEEDHHLEILRQRSAALAVDVAPEEERSPLNYGGSLNAAAASLWTGPPSAGSRPNRAISKRASSSFGKGAARWSSTSSMEGTKPNGRSSATKKGSSSKIHAAVSPKGMARQEKHAMLSYQWDHQTEVTVIRKMLEARDGAEKIVKQIDRTMDVYSKRPGSAFSDTDGDTDHSSTEDDEEGFSVEDMRGELERLMSDLRVAKYSKGSINPDNMVLDDAWEVAHCEQLAFIDDSTQSKLLVSSRVKGVLEGGSIVDLNLPSDYDAQKMLLNEAGLDADPSDAPPEAAEVTKFCNNLPLAVGMAGRLLKTMSLSIDDDWSGVVAVLKSEFGEGGQARSMENSIIRTSLKSVRGSQHDEVVQLFHAFALVPEDTVCPLEIIGIMFAATGLVLQKGKSRRLQTIPPRLMVRKWLKILIDRSLVLGTVDRPQLHDIVLEYVEAQFTDQECRQAHREVIEKFREATPAGGWSRMGAGTDLTSYYVVHEIEHHISAAWGKEKMKDKVAIGWCSDLWRGKTDAITSAATLHLGYDNLKVFAEDAEAKNDHWRAVRLYTAVISAMYDETGDMTKCKTLLHRLYSELKLCTQDTPELKFDFETIEIDVVLRIIKCWNKDDLDALVSRVPVLLETQAAKADFQSEYTLKIMLEVVPSMMNGDSKEMYQAIRETTLRQIEKTKTIDDPGHINRSRLLEVGYSAIFFDGCAADTSFIDALYGERGCKIEQAYAGYDRDTDHVDCIGLYSIDIFVGAVGDVKALMFFWGEIDRARAMARWHINECAACFATRDVTAEQPTIFMASVFMPEACLLTGLQSEAHTA
eukprot:gene11701-19336_t